MKACKGAPFRERLFFVLGIAIVIGFVPEQVNAEGQPNIIVVMADDHGQWCIELDND